MHKKIPSMTVGEMKVALNIADWLWENVLGTDYETQNYIFEYHGGYNKFWEKNLWAVMYPQYFK